MSDPTTKPGQLFLTVREGVEVPCRRCLRAVDFGKLCELVRRSDGSVRVIRCNACLVEDLDAPAPKRLRGLCATDGHLMRDGSCRWCGDFDTALLPTPGSRWRYTDPRSPADQLEFTFRRFVGEGLVFAGPYGEWFCSREDWADHLATFRVRPFVAPPVRAQA